MSNTVIIEKNGQFLTIHPAPDELQENLQTVTHLVKDAQRGSAALARSPMPLYRKHHQDGRDCLCCFAGLEDAVKESLNRAGYQVVVEQQGHGCSPLPTLQGPKSSSQNNRPFLNFIKNNERGLIRYSNNADVVHVIATVARTWPTLRMAIPVSRAQEARALRNRLRKCGIDAVAISSRNQVGIDREFRIAVTTFHALGHLGVEVEKLPLIFVPNALEASNPVPLSHLGHAHQARIFGFLSRDARLAPQQRDCIHLIFGFQEHSCSARSVEVVWCKTTGGAAIRSGDDLLTLKRSGIWKNDLRNRRQARLALAVMNHDLNVLKSFSPVISQVLKNRPVSRVMIVVENKEHAGILAGLLPNWPVITDDPVRTMSTQTTQILPAPVCAITTLAGLEHSHLAQCDVLLRADGGTGNLPLSKALQINEIIYGVKNLLLIDFKDSFHPVLRRWSRQRRQAYESQGWFAPGVDPAEARIRQFLDRRKVVLS